MAFDKSNIGKSCYINISNEAGIDDSALAKIIGYFNEANEEYYFVSIIPDGKVIKVRDDSLINIIEDGGSVAVGLRCCWQENHRRRVRRNYGRSL